MVEQLRNKTKEELMWAYHIAEEENDTLKEFIKNCKRIPPPL